MTKSTVMRDNSRATTSRDGTAHPHGPQLPERPATREWRDVAALILAEGGPPQRSRHLGALYALACRDGRMRTRSFARVRGDEAVLDLVHDLLSERATEIVMARNPRAFFLTCLTRRAIDGIRRSGEHLTSDGAPDEEARDGVDDEASVAFVLDARAALHELSPRDAAVVVATAEGENREAVARAAGTSRANVDQIVSRVRRSLARRAA